jgi:hypothetical protein
VLYAFKITIMKKQWTIEISQNGWEYIGTATITAIKVEKINDTTVLADGIEIEFNEEISFDEE